ncbi:MAG TPA: type II secretion system protein, partial [Candidatus Polarisedimenticolia bacterium]|nr:type II secretion system protein [Candidatus Polarisedimenticolia bacterium]
MAVSNDFGGSLDWVMGGNAFRHFQVMSNELSTPRVVYCATDTQRSATNFGNDFNNERVSFFVGLDARKDDPRSLLFGDRNITNEITPDQSIMTLEAGQLAGWNEKMHNRCGNVAAMDGSVHQLSNADLRRMLKETSGWTN